MPQYIADAMTEEELTRQRLSQTLGPFTTPSDEDVPTNSLGGRITAGGLQQNASQGILDPLQFGSKLRESMSPARELLSNLFSGISSSMLGTKYEPTRQRLYGEYLTAAKLRQGEERIQNTLSIAQAADARARALAADKNKLTEDALNQRRFDALNKDALAKDRNDIARQVADIRERLATGQLSKIEADLEMVPLKADLLKAQTKKTEHDIEKGPTDTWNQGLEEARKAMKAAGENREPTFEEILPYAQKIRDATKFQPAGAQLLPPETASIIAQFARAKGELPSVPGMGNVGVRNQVYTEFGKQVMQDAQQGGQNPEEVVKDLVAHGAAYVGRKAALTQITKNRAAVEAFEGTASKNLDLFLGQARKVIDTDSPWMNSPLRTVNQKALGGPELAAYNAARQVAINEIARVVSNPALTGVLSDSARKEVEQFIPANATLKQVFAVAAILRKDMANRLSTLRGQEKQLQDEIRGAGAPIPEAPTAPKIDFQPRR